METHTNLMYDGACEKNKYDLYSGSAAKAVIDSCYYANFLPPCLIGSPAC